ELPDQAAERRSVTAIAAVGGQILRNEVQLDHPFGGQRFGLGAYGVEGPTLVTTANLRNDAEATGVVAALGYLEIGTEEAARAYPRERKPRQQMRGTAVDAGVGRARLRQDCGQAREVRSAQKRVHLGERRLQLAAVALHQAPGDHQALGGICLLEA